MKWVESVIDNLDKIVDIISKIGLVIAGTIVAIEVILITAYVISREIFSGGWQFVEEWGAFLLVLLGYCCFAGTLRNGQHIRVDSVVRFLPKKVRLWLAVITSFFSLVMLALFLKLSIDRVIYSIEERIFSTTAVLTPMWIPEAFVPLGLSMFFLAMAVHVVRRIADAITGEEEKKKASI